MQRSFQVINQVAAEKFVEWVDPKDVNSFEGENSWDFFRADLQDSADGRFVNAFMRQCWQRVERPIQLLFIATNITIGEQIAGDTFQLAI